MENSDDKIDNPTY